MAKVHGKLAFEIQWDTGDEGRSESEAREILETLPTEIFIPDGVTENYSDYISDETGFCHTGFRLKEAEYDM